MSRTVLQVTTPLLSPDQTDRLQDIVFHHFPYSRMEGGADVEEREGEEVELVRAVEEEMRERHLQIQPEVTEKVSSQL